MASIENIIVIGGGLMGSSAAWELAKYGQKVLLLEQQSREYNNGSSYGDARISRSLGPKKDIFSFVQNTTVTEVKTLLRFLNGLSLNQPHQIKDIYTTSPVSYLFPQDEEAKVAQICHKKQKDKYRKASGDAAFRKFGVTIPDTQILVREYKKYSGTFNPHVLIQKLHLGIKQKGSTIKYARKVTSVVKENGRYKIKVKNVQTDKMMTLYARQVIVAVGPYTGQVLRKIAPYFNKLITPKRVPLAFFRIRKKRFTRLTKAEKKSIFDAHPIFDQNRKMFFAMVEERNKKESPLFKVGGHQIRRNIIDLDRIWRQPPLRKEIKWAKKQFRKYLEMLEIYIDKKDIECVKSYNCVYAMTKSETPFVTPILTPNQQIDTNLIVIGGMSGVGAKGCLAYGMMAADWLLGVNENSKIYKKTKRELSNPLLRLNTKKRTAYRLF